MYKHLPIVHPQEVSGVTDSLRVLLLFSAKLLDDRLVPSFLSPFDSIEAPGWAQCWSLRQMNWGYGENTG